MSIAARFEIRRGDFCLDVNLQFPMRGVSAIFGPSGSGKTTLLRAIAGLEQSPQGFLQVGGRIWQDQGLFVPPHQRSIGYVFQEPSLFPHLTVQGNIDYGRRRVAADRQRVSVDEVLDLLGIGELLGRMPHQLSGGEQQRVAIARALATSPSVLLMDEPLASLDTARKQEILPYFESLHRELEIPMLYVSHARDEVMRLGDHIALLERGKVLATGPVVELFSRLDLPIAHDHDVKSVIETRVAGRDEQFGLSSLEFPGGRFAVASRQLELGSTVRLLVRASDVSITLERDTKTSILNVFPATIAELVPEKNAQVLVRLEIGGIPMLSSITRKSATGLGLQPGMAVYAQVKSVALAGQGVV